MVGLRIKVKHNAKGYVRPMRSQILHPTHRTRIHRESEADKHEIHGPTTVTKQVGGTGMLSQSPIVYVSTSDSDPSGGCLRAGWPSRSCTTVKKAVSKMLSVHWIWICPAHLWLKAFESSTVSSLACSTGSTPGTTLVQPSESPISFWPARKSVRSLWIP